MRRIIAGFDSETTGLFEPEHRIIEAALVLYDLDTEQELASFVRRWNPGRPIDPDAQAVHGITFEAVSMCPMLKDDEEGIAKIQQIAGATLFWVAHNGVGFDMPFIQQEFAGIGRTLPPIHCVDTMLEGTWATPFGKRPNLGELCFATRTPYDPEQAHAAKYDVDRMMKAYFYGLKRGFFSLPEHAKVAT